MEARWQGSLAKQSIEVSLLGHRRGQRGQEMGLTMRDVQQTQRAELQVSDPWRKGVSLRKLKQKGSAC